MNEVDWLLKRDGELLGSLKLVETDMFWFFCSFKAEETFEQYRPLFDKQTAMSLAEDDDAEAWERSEYEIVALNLHLEGIGKNESYEEFLLNIDGAEASVRPML